MKHNRKISTVARVATFAALAIGCFTPVTGTAVAAVHWNPSLANGSTANAKGNGFAPPTIGATSNATSSSIQVNWTAPATGATPDHYTVSRCSGSWCSTFALISNGTCSGKQAGTSCVDTDTGLATGTTYEYEVTAVLGSNWASTSGSAVGTTLIALSFTNSSGTASCTSSHGSNTYVVPSGGATFFVTRSQAQSSSVSVSVSTPSNSPAVTGSPLTIAANGTTTTGSISVAEPGSNGGINMTASATGYGSATCKLFKN